jgi:FAD/FMN-containing dehydrogenase
MAAGEAAIAGLRAAMRGRLLRPGDAGYDDARKLWNAMIDRHPGLIARCAGAADVVACVDFARENNVLVSVKGGGHNVPGVSVCDGGLVIDCSDMKGIRVDPERRVAWAQPGLRWGEFDRETQAFGLATTGGTNTDTGIAGLTLGGGMGWLGGKHGLTVDNVLGVDIVTADGRLRHASADNNPDLYWAVRGGGGNFGVITAFEYQLHPVGLVLGGMIAFPIDVAGAYLRAYRDFVATAPDELVTLAGLGTLPDGSRAVLTALCYNGDLAAGEKAIEPLTKFGQPLMAQVAQMPYVIMQGLLDDLGPPGRRYYAKGPFLKSLSESVIDDTVAYFERVPSPFTGIMLQHKAGAMSRGGEGTSFGQRAAPFNYVIFCGWEDAATDEANVAWARALAQAVEAETTGSYVNDLGVEADEGSQQIRAAFGANYDRLVQVKTKYDPTNLFRHNQNIRPAEA